jgi:putative ABC transport system ATP-binding protein
VCHEKKKENAMTVIQTSALSASYQSGTVHLKFPDLVIDPGEKVLLLGASGSGKSSFLSLIAGLLSPATGSVHIHNQDLHAMPNRQRDLFRGQNFGFIFQNHHLISSMTVLQNIKLPIDMLGISCPQDKLKKILASLGLTDKENRKPRELSHGEQQRVALARALIHSPSIVIADEPTSALDDNNAQQVMDLFERQCVQNGAALVVATHDHRIKHKFDTIIPLGH